MANSGNTFATSNTAPISFSISGGTNNVTVVDQNNLVFAASSVSGNLAVTTSGGTGAMTQTGALTVGGTTSISASGSADTIDLSTNGASNTFTNTVTLSNSGAFNVSLTDTVPLILGTSSVGNNLALTIAGTNGVTETGTLTVPGTTTFTASAANTDVILNTQANNFTGALSFSGTVGNFRDISIRNTNSGAALPTNLASLTSLRNLNIIFNNASVAFPALTLTNSGV